MGLAICRPGGGERGPGSSLTLSLFKDQSLGVYIGILQILLGICECECECVFVCKGDQVQIKYLHITVFQTFRTGTPTVRNTVYVVHTYIFETKIS